MQLAGVNIILFSHTCYYVVDLFPLVSSRSRGPMKLISRFNVRLLLQFRSASRSVPLVVLMKVIVLRRGLASENIDFRSFPLVLHGILVVGLVWEDLLNY